MSESSSPDPVSAAFVGGTDRTRLRIRLTPKGGRDRLDGVVSDASDTALLKVRVTAPPVDGAANTALIKLIAKALGIPKSRVALVSGEASRVKVLELDLPKDDAEAALAKALPG